MRQHHTHHRTFHYGPIKLPAWQRHGVYASLSILAVSGLWWLGLHFADQSEEGLTQNIAKLWAIRAHAAAALWTLVMAGSLLPAHMRVAWHTRKNRVSGACVTLVLLVLTLTGYALGYVPESWVRQWSTWLHWSIGAAVPLILVVHIMLGRRARSRP
jgi:hypothetical protein